MNRVPRSLCPHWPPKPRKKRPEQPAEQDPERIQQLYHNFAEEHSQCAEQAEQKEKGLVQQSKRAEYHLIDKPYGKAGQPADRPDQTEDENDREPADEQKVKDGAGRKSDEHKKSELAPVAVLQNAEHEEGGERPIKQVEDGKEPARHPQLPSQHAVGVEDNPKRDSAPEHQAHGDELNGKRHLNSLPSNPLDLPWVLASA